MSSIQATRPTLAVTQMNDDAGAATAAKPERGFSRVMTMVRTRGAKMGKGLLIGGVVVGVSGMAIGALVGAYIDPLAAGAFALGGGYVGSKIGMLAGVAAAALFRP